MWAERYADASFYYGTEPNDFLIEGATEIPVGGRALCLGEDEGRNAVFLAGLGFRAVALDQSAVGLRKALQLAEARRVSLTTLQASLDGYCMEPDSWGAIVSIWCHVPTTVRAEVHAQVVAGLKPGGVYLLEAYRPARLQFGTGGPKSVDMLPTLAQLREELRGLEFVHATEREREVHEGQGHSGHSAVVRVLARKAR